MARRVRERTLLKVRGGSLGRRGSSRPSAAPPDAGGTVISRLGSRTLKAAATNARHVEHAPPADRTSDDPMQF